MPTYEYECRSGHRSERQSSFADAKKWVRCRQCHRRARRVMPTSVAFVIGPDRRATERQARETKEQKRLENDLYQKKVIERAFAEDNVLDFKSGKPGHATKPDIDHARRMGPGKKGVLPPLKKPRDGSRDPIRMRPVKKEA